MHIGCLFLKPSIYSIKQAKIETNCDAGKGQIVLHDVIRVGALAFIAQTLAEEINDRERDKNEKHHLSSSDKDILNKWLQKHYEVTQGALETENSQLLSNKYRSLYNAVNEQFRTTTKNQKNLFIKV